MPTRLAFLLLLASAVTPLRAGDPAAAVEQAHTELWRRFIDKHDVMLDFTGLDGSVSLPTPEECREGKPNALGWWAPIENGAMFNGMYLDGLVSRWERTRTDEDAAKARRIAEGLLYLNTVSDVPGFVARGVSTDGRSHYPMGSNDQTAPWFFGLWRYWNSPIASAAEKDRIVGQVLATGRAIEALGWKMPAEPPFGTRGSFEGFHFEEVSRKLFVMKLLHAVSGDASWDAKYRAELIRIDGEEKRSKLEIARGGMKFFYARTHNWTSCAGVACLRALWEMEDDPATKAAYADGLAASARLAAESLSLHESFTTADGSVFETDWRTSMLPLWKPQQTEQEAVDLAHAQLKAFLKVSPRRQIETAHVREPTSAAWIISLCPEQDLVESHREAIGALIAAYDYRELYYSTFFWVECAWWRLPSPDQPDK